MKSIVASRRISAPLGLVFETVSDIRNFRNAIPNITAIEFLTERNSGVGTRFRETRMMKGRENSVELEVAELRQNECVRMVSDAGGTIWDSVFSVSENGEMTDLSLTMDVRPYKLSARLMNVLVRPMIVRALEADMDAVKAYCEAQSASG